MDTNKRPECVFSDAILHPYVQAMADVIVEYSINDINIGVLYREQTYLFS